MVKSGAFICHMHFMCSDMKEGGFCAALEGVVEYIHRLIYAVI